MSTTAKRLTRREVAATLGVTARTVARWTERGLLSATRWESPLGKVYWDYDAVEVGRLAEAMRGAPHA